MISFLLPIFLAGAACALVLSLLRIAWLIRVGRNIALGSKAFERQLPHANFRILVIGDSMAVGTGAEDPRDSVAGRLGKLFPESSIENHGVNGALTGEIISQVPLEVPQKFDLVIIQAGGNDILRIPALAKVREDIERLLDRATKVGQVTLLLTAGDVGRSPFFPRIPGRFYSRRTRLVRNIFRDYAREKNVHYIDLLIPGVDDVFASDPRRYYAGDFLHPSGEGYGVWFQEIERVVRPVHSPP